MPTVTIECRTEAEAVSLRHAAAFLAEMHHLAQSAPVGQTLSLLEGHALGDGRQLLRTVLQSAAQDRIDHAEKKGATLVAARAPAVPAATGSRAGTAATG